MKDAVEQPKAWEAFFCNWRSKLKAKLREKLPSFDPTQLEAVCKTVQKISDTKQSAQKLVDAVSKESDAIKGAAQTTFYDVESAFDASLEACQAASNAIVEGLSILDNDSCDCDLVLYYILHHGGDSLATWCVDHPDQVPQLLGFLKDTPLQRRFVLYGGARQGQYGRAVSLHETLKPKSCSKILERLALAVALELCEPLKLFNDTGFVDPVARYQHYETAYLEGQLDPAFESFDVWHLRLVVNCNATDEELIWGRQCLLAYRPDHVISQDMHWRYCRIVKTDVTYTTPDWYKSPHSYDQILSGGGQCGPRAWYGRFILRAFGIPVWGVQQPGHAALTHWTPNGFEVCLGGGIWKSWWEDQGGDDFVLESQARAVLENEYQRHVQRLEWISTVWDEDWSVVRRLGLPDSCSPWYTLSMMQRRHAAQRFQPRPLLHHRAVIEPSEVCLYSEGIVHDNDAIVIPAASCSFPEKPTDKVLWLPSALGGQQLYLQQDAEVTYDLPLSVLNGHTPEFELSIRVSTAHRFEEPILVTITDDSLDIDTVYVVKLPYTTGLWDWTPAIRISLSDPCEIKIQRPKQPFGFSFKEIRLIPV